MPRRVFCISKPKQIPPFCWEGEDVPILLNCRFFSNAELHGDIDIISKKEAEEGNEGQSLSETIAAGDSSPKLALVEVESDFDNSTEISCIDSDEAETCTADGSNSDKLSRTPKVEVESKDDEGNENIHPNIKIDSILLRHRSSPEVWDKGGGFGLFRACDRSSPSPLKLKLYIQLSRLNSHIFQGSKRVHVFFFANIVTITSISFFIVFVAIFGPIVNSHTVICVIAGREEVETVPVNRYQNSSYLLEWINSIEEAYTSDSSTLDSYIDSLNLGKTGTSLPYGTHKNDHLEGILHQMRDAAERKRELEKEHGSTLATLRDKQSEMQWNKNLSANEASKLRDTVESLQSKVRELEKKLELQNVHHEELLLELASAERSSHKLNVPTTSSAYHHLSHKPLAHQEVQTSPESNTSYISDVGYSLTSSTSASYDSGNVYGHDIHSKYHHYKGYDLSKAPPRSTAYIDNRHAALDAYHSCGSNTCAAAIRPPIPHPSCPTCQKMGQQQQQQQQHQLLQQQQQQLLQQQQQQLEPPCTCGLGAGVTAEPLVEEITPSNESCCCSDDSGVQTVAERRVQSDIPDVDKIMAKIDQDNKVLAELDKTHNSIMAAMKVGIAMADQTRNIAEYNNMVQAQAFAAQQQQIQLAVVQQQQLQTPVPLPVGYQGQVPFDAGGRTSAFTCVQPKALQTQYLPYQHNQPNLFSQLDLECQNILGTGSVPVAHYGTSSELMLPHEPMQDYMSERNFSRASFRNVVDIPGKGICNVYIVKYSYDPFSQSTSNCPDAELHVNAGDYLLVYGTADEDGYMEAEMMDGRRGLVPAIFIQKLSGEELIEFKRRFVMMKGEDCISTNIHQNMAIIAAEEQRPKNFPDYCFGNTVQEDDEEVEGADNVPAPRQLTLERQLNKSILIRWNPPSDSPSHLIESYHIYVDGNLKTTVKSSDRTKALLEGVDATKPHRISIRSVTRNRRTSRDAACTMMIGKDVPGFPTNVKASRVTATSAIISWLPSNSNYPHTVCINNVEVRTVKPGIYRHTITGLVPNTVYRVTVRAKNIRAPHYDDKNMLLEKLATHMDFRTLPKGLPDPPAEIQVEPGPQDGSLLVTWIPVSGDSSNGALITGYAVYADGRKVSEIDSPTGDHALIDISKILSLKPRHITVRTKSKENHSSDSQPAAIPQSLRRRPHDLPDSGGSHHRRTLPPTPKKTSKGYKQPPARNAYGQVIIDPDENLSDKEVYPDYSLHDPTIDIIKEITGDGNYSEEEFYEAHSKGKQTRFAPQSRNQPPKSHAERGRPPPPHVGHIKPFTSGQRRPDALSTRSSDYPELKGRLCIAICDYDPKKNCSNPSTSEEELQFYQGDHVKIFGEKDPDGFYWGECRGKRGFVPDNYIVDVETYKLQKMGEPKKMVVLYNYDAENPSEVTLQEGQVVTVYGTPDDVGFYLGEVEGGGRGLLPSNYLQEIAEIGDETGSGSSGAQPNTQNDYTRGPQNRNVARLKQDRGQGPGARGPPPPPRDGMPPRTDTRDRRKDTYRSVDRPQDQQANSRLQGLNGPQPQGRRLGREPSLDRNQNTGVGGPGGIRTSMGGNQQQNFGNQQQTLGNQQQGFGNQHQQGFGNRAPGPIRPQQQQQDPNANQGHSMMQRLTEMTSGVTHMTAGAAQENPVDLLNKGKDFLLMKFGLGK